MKAKITLDQLTKIISNGLMDTINKAVQKEIHDKFDELVQSAAEQVCHHLNNFMVEAYETVFPHAQTIIHLQINKDGKPEVEKEIKS